MTSLTNQQPEYTYPDLLTTTNSGQGLASTLKNLQDGIGNNSTVQIATNAINFNRTGGNTFQLDGVAMDSTSANINSVCKLNPVLPGTGSVLIPVGTTAERSGVPTVGMMRYNSDLNMFEGYRSGTWQPFNSGSFINTITGTTNQIVITGTATDPIIGLASDISGINSLSTATIQIGVVAGNRINGTVGIDFTTTASSITFTAAGISPVESYSDFSIRNGKIFSIYNSDLTPHAVRLQCPAGMVNVTYTLPGNGARNGQVMYNDGTGSLFWTYPNYFYNYTFKASHGFAVGNIIKMSPISGYSLAQANSAANAEVVGIIVEVVNSNFFVIQFGGLVEFGITAVLGTTYFLDPSTPGAYTDTAPSASGQVVKPLFIAETNSSAYWLNQRGNIIP